MSSTKSGTAQPCHDFCHHIGRSNHEPPALYSIDKPSEKVILHWPPTDSISQLVKKVLENRSCRIEKCVANNQHASWITKTFAAKVIEMLTIRWNSIRSILEDHPFAALKSLTSALILIFDLSVQCLPRLLLHGMKHNCLQTVLLEQPRRCRFWFSFKST